MTYEEFIKTKEIPDNSCGFEPVRKNDSLFDWQNDIVRWACMKGKSCIFADCGLGKTAMQLEWAWEVNNHTNKPVLVLSPLAVAQQTKREGDKFGIGVIVCRTMLDVETDKINVTNYEMLEHFDAAAFSGIVLDESSILKNQSGKTRKYIQDSFKDTPYKLCCTATPAPNDFMEIGTHAEFVGVMRYSEMLSTYFVHDGGDTSKWRLKGHAVSKFFEWVASWACCLTSPADLGYSGDNFMLPPLNVYEVSVASNELTDSDGQEMLFCKTTQTLNERREARRNSLEDRVSKAAEIANSYDGQVLVWCDLNSESSLLTKSIEGAVEVCGSMPNDTKEENMDSFSRGVSKALVSKPSIAGWGMNWQQCSRMIFVGLSDSFESYYQAIRRCYRFGQKKPVDVYIVISDAEGAVKENIARKQKDAQKMTQELVKFTKDIISDEIHHTFRNSEKYITTEEVKIPKWIA